MPSDPALLNSFALRSFRDQADRDYIHARLAYKHKLVPQFLWSSLHCLEKYAKGVLLLNRIPAHRVKYEVSGALALISKQARFQVQLSEQTISFIERLESGAEFRYFEVSYFNEEYDIVRLDRAVAEFRRYCQVLDWKVETPTGLHDLLPGSVERIQRAFTERHRDTCIENGLLEQVLKKSDHPARTALVWKNLYFGGSQRRTVKLHGWIEAGNAPLYLHPEILDDVLKYVFMPKRVEQAWRQELASRIAAGGA
jgi:hypothetical protein